MEFSILLLSDLDEPGTASLVFYFVRVRINNELIPFLIYEASNIKLVTEKWPLSINYLPFSPQLRAS
jgi:hypothetical protein